MISNYSIPITSMIIISCSYGLQIIVFIMKMEWEMIGWLVFYLFSLPIFGFLLPMYSFWHFDDFSWGNTRKILSQNDGKQVIIEKAVDMGEVKKQGLYSV